MIHTYMMNVCASIFTLEILHNPIYIGVEANIEPGRWRSKEAGYVLGRTVGLF